MKASRNKKGGENALAMIKAVAKNLSSQDLDNLRRYISVKHNDLEYCPFCDNAIHDKEVNFTKETTLYAIEKMLKFVEETGKHEFAISEIAPMLSKAQYNNLNHLVYLGGILYRPKDPKTGEQAHIKYYGINVERALEFTQNKRKLPRKTITNTETGEVQLIDECYASEFPNTKDKLDENGYYQP